MDTITYIETKLSSKQKGSILEKRFIEIVSLTSNGKISCFTPDSDDDGIDIVVNLKSDFKPIFIQVKSRFNLNKNGTYSQDIGVNTFGKNEKFYICFFLYDVQKLDIDKIWLVPSIEFAHKAIELQPENYAQKLRFAASVKDESDDKWSPYRIDKMQLGEKLLAIINDVYKNS